MKKLLLSCFSLSIFSLCAQDSCNCLINLNNMIDKVTNNYAGFKDKINSTSIAGYNRLTDSLKSAAVKVDNLGDCYKLLERYRLYFYDKHLQLRATLPVENNSSTLNVPVPINTGWTKAAATSYFTKKKATLNPLEGIWKTDGYEIAVIKNEKSKQYEAAIITADNKNWKQGMLKFRSKAEGTGKYTTIYNRGDFITDTTTSTVRKNFLEMERYGSWQKTFPPVKDSLTTAAYNTTYGGQVQLRMLDSKTVYIRLQSCDLANKPVLDSLLKSNAKKLKIVPNWIVDFRGNQGGSTDVFLGMLPYFYTKPLIEKGDKHWMTPENTAGLKKFTEENRKVLDQKSLEYLDGLVKYGEANVNGWHDTGPDTTRFDKVLPYPTHIAVLSDKNNGSSGETFLLVAKGISDKVVIFGENSAGYMDYGDLQPFSFPCSKLELYIPSRRSNYLDDGKTYSYVGVPPDVYIAATNKDWIKFVFDYWKNH